MINDINIKRAKLAAVAAAAVLAVAGVGALATSDSDDPTTATLQDAGLSSSAGTTRTTDLLTAPVAPGASITTGVNLPPFGRVLSVSGPSSFSVGPLTHKDNKDATWFEVTVTNESHTTQRFAAFVSFTVKE